ncbi:hypothetical protein [Sorangium sp. So ce1097]|uniref:hypothetical protein n=1 Tax=Sorangium sp. So ce1097 TaxID=3133330 RepID=UPI003F618DBC
MAKPPRTITFREQLVGSVHDFLESENMQCLQTAQAVIELIVSLAAYREEGVVLFPQVFICDNLAIMLRTLQGRDHCCIGSGPPGAATMHQAMKRCAPLARGGWHIYIHRQHDKFEYGVFRATSLPLAETPLDTLSVTLDPELHTICALQLASNAVELRGACGSTLHVHLSDQRADQPPPTKAIEDLVRAASADVALEHAEQVAGFLRRTLFEIMQISHGSLAVVLSHNTPEMPEILSSGVRLNPPIDIQARISSYKSSPTEENAASLVATGPLLAGMMASDGITIFRSDAKVLAYNVFLKDLTSKTIDDARGGARSRAYLKLCQSLDTDISAAFFRSHDGRTEYAQGVPHV